MNTWTLNNFIIFLIFFVPGFISIKVYDTIIPGEKRDFTKAIFDALTYGAINFAFFLWLIILIGSISFDKYEVSKFIILFTIVFIAPIFWPIIYLKILSWRPIRNRTIHPILKPWDYVFGRKTSYWIIIHLKNGKRIGGTYKTKSFASSYPASEQIYLEEVWKLNKDCSFYKPVERSRGIIVNGSEIEAVELFF